MVDVAIPTLVCHTLGVVGLIAHLQSSISIIHRTPAGLGFLQRWCSALFLFLGLQSGSSAGFPAQGDRRLIDWPEAGYSQRPASNPLVYLKLFS